MVTVTIGSGVKLESNAYAHSEEITKVVIMQNAEITSAAFPLCHNLQEIEVHSGATLRKGAFTQCKNIIRVNLLLGANVDNGGFSHCHISNLVTQCRNTLNSSAFTFCKFEIVECLEHSETSTMPFVDCEATALVLRPMSSFTHDHRFQPRYTKYYDTATVHEAPSGNKSQSFFSLSDLSRVWFAKVYREYFINRVYALSNKRVVINLCGAFPSLAALCVKALTTGDMHNFFPELPLEDSQGICFGRLQMNSKQYLFAKDFVPFVVTNNSGRFYVEDEDGDVEVLGRITHLVSKSTK